MNPAVRPACPGTLSRRKRMTLKTVRNISIPGPHSGMFLPSLDVWPPAHVAPTWTETSGPWDRQLQRSDNLGGSSS